MSATFTEKSSAFRPVFLITFLPVSGILIFLLIKGIANRDTTDIVLLSIFLLIHVLVLTVMAVNQLQLSITETGISFSYRAFLNKQITYTRDQIQSVQLLRIDPLTAFSGWGKKYSKQYGKGYLTKGDHVIHLMLKDGDNITLSVLDLQQAALMIPAELSV